MSRKKKKAMGNIEIKDAKDPDKEEMEKNEEQITDEETAECAEETVKEPEETEETETAEAAGEAEEACDEQEDEPEQEPAGEAQDQDAAEENNEGQEKPKKKERRLKWAKSYEKEQEKILDEVQTKINEANDRYARLFAEFDNFRKRSEKEKAQRYDFGAKDMVERILPVIDNFERGLAAVMKEGKEEDSFVKGMEMTYKQLLKVLEDAGVKPIEAVGQEFNPDFHNAVMHVDDPEAGENVIVEEFQKGYMYKDQVVRYSMVKVAN